MFNAKELDLMKKIGLVLNFSSLTDAEFIKIESVVGDYYTKIAQSTNSATKDILICESILDKL